MSSRAVISLTTGLDNAENVTVAFLVAVGAVETGRETTLFSTEEAVSLAVPGLASATASAGCPDLESLLERYAAAGGRSFVCPICFGARGLDPDAVLEEGRFRRGSGSVTTQPSPSATEGAVRRLPQPSSPEVMVLACSGWAVSDEGSWPGRRRLLLFQR